MVNIKLTNYTSKSFVITGDDTVSYKESLKKLGGKWNSRLTNKETGQKFGGWIFYNDLRPTVEEWLKHPNKPIENNNITGFANSESLISRLEKRVKYLESEMENIKKMLHSTQVHEYTMSESDDEDETPRKRLLR